MREFVFVCVCVVLIELHEGIEDGVCMSVFTVDCGDLMTHSRVCLQEDIAVCWRRLVMTSLVEQQD